jgi:MFS family permease
MFSGSDFESSNRVSWIAVAYILSTSAGQPLYGRLSDIFGRKQCLLFANTVFLLGTLGCAVAPGLWSLVGSRIVAGIGGGGLNVLVYPTKARRINCRELLSCPI